MLYIALGLALLSFTLLYNGAYSNGSTNITVAINATRQYLEKVNESAYLVFYPNLDYAYNALNDAVKLSRTNTTGAYALLQLATASAAAAQHRIYQYSLASFYVLAIVSVVFAAMLYSLMRKSRRRG
jgi:hypothetical protein